MGEQAKLLRDARVDAVIRGRLKQYIGWTASAVRLSVTTPTCECWATQRRGDARVYGWSNLSKFARTLQKGQLITLEGTLRYREDEVEATRFKHRIAEVHAIRMKRLSKIEAADDPADVAGDE
jgi:hypothetical protein